MLPSPRRFPPGDLLYDLQFGEPFMKLKLVAAISALAIPALAHAQPKAPKPTKADAQNVVQIITSDKVKTQAYCDLTKLEEQVKAVQKNTDTKTVETLTKQSEALIDKLGPEYFKLMDGLERVDPILAFGYCIVITPRPAAPHLCWSSLAA